eukprot:CAMPEP_0170177626 /NCGR_PEP_ID=MMETSP0040_2-20121228/10633_1 /TAXON_ID=641309 /ORGANISM="Lotharella oceanica, Strain CCMP622" /LENGTH=119 /DNA_ID=CAMNT_0010420323 /DNA_START=166 /DNA_END=522 /DNA_ORIENTATION=+
MRREEALVRRRPGAEGEDPEPAHDPHHSLLCTLVACCLLPSPHLLHLFLGTLPCTFRPCRRPQLSAHPVLFHECLHAETAPAVVKGHELSAPHLLVGRNIGCRPFGEPMKLPSTSRRRA